MYVSSKKTDFVKLAQSFHLEDFNNLIKSAEQHQKEGSCEFTENSFEIKIFFIKPEYIHRSIDFLDVSFIFEHKLNSEGSI